jgi:hypothetical protein
MSGEMTPNFQRLGYKVILNKSLNLTKAFILYNLKTKKYSHNLSGFMIYDSLVDENPQQLLNILLEKGNIHAKNTNNLDRFDLLDLLRNNKMYYGIFKEIINIEKIFIDSIIHKPVKKQFIEEEGYIYLNLYKYNNHFDDVKPNINASFPYIKEFLLNLCGQNKDFYNKFIEVCAWKTQFPLIMLSQCNFIFQDKGGTGKSEILLDLILKKLFNVKMINQSILEMDFNSYMINSQWVVVEEVEGFKDAKKIKSLTGAKSIMLNEKGLAIYEIINYSNFIIFSNELKTLQLDENDRRFNVGGGGSRLSPRPCDTWENTYFESEINNVKFFENFDKNLNNEIKEIYSYFLAMELKRTHVQQLVNTEQRNNLINLGKTSEKLLLDDIKSLGFDGLINLIDYGNKIKIQDLIHSYEGENYILYKDIYNIYISYHNNYMNRKTGEIGKNFLQARLSNYSVYDEIFSEYKRVRFIEGDPRVFKIIKKKVIMNENLNKEEITQDLN